MGLKNDTITNQTPKASTANKQAKSKQAKIDLSRKNSQTNIKSKRQNHITTKNQ